MATITQHSSPPKQRHHKRKNSDPYSALSSASAPQNDTQDPQDPLLARLFMTPILFTSFLLSLFLINRSDRARRAGRPRGLWASLSPRIWLDPEPYQDPNDSTWNTATTSSSAAHYTPSSALNPKGLATGADVASAAGLKGRKGAQKWHLNNSIRKISKIEITDAFEWQGFAAVALIFGILFVGIGLIVGLGYMTMVYSERRFGIVNHDRGGRFF